MQLEMSREKGMRTDIILKYSKSYRIGEQFRCIKGYRELPLLRAAR